MIALVDLGIGNIASIERAFSRIGKKVKVTSVGREIATAEKIVLPGVGSFGAAAYQLDKLNIRKLLLDLCQDRERQILGICLGMQLLFEASEESPGYQGLGVLKGCVTRLESGGRPYTHMGWNTLRDNNLNVTQFSCLSEVTVSQDYYFVHSYGVVSEQSGLCCRTKLADEESCFVSYLEADNLTACQFHPEKSHFAGLDILERWVVK